MSDKKWGERVDALGIVDMIIKLMFLLAAVLIPVGAIAFCVDNHISVDDISQQVRRLINGNGDEKGFVKAMHDDTAFNRFNSAEMLGMGHQTCGWLRKGSGPNELINWMDGAPGMSDYPPELRHKVELDLITNSQIYLCPDTLHNGMAETPTPTTTARTTPPGGPTLSTTTTTTPTTTMTPTTMVKSPPALGSACTDHHKIAYDSTAEQELACSEHFEPSHGWLWETAPPMDGVHTLGTSCEGERPWSASRTTDDYVIICQPADITSVSPIAGPGSTWKSPANI